MNITKYRHFDSLTYLHVLGITSSGGHTLISGNFRYISANFRSETGSDAAHAVWPVLNVNWVAAPSMWTGVASDPRSESVRREYSNAAWVSAPSMWAECRPPPCGLSARPLHVGGGPAPSMWTECPPPPCGLRLRAAVRGFSITVPCRQTMTVWLEKMYSEAAASLCEILSEKVSITTDSWKALITESCVKVSFLPTGLCRVRSWRPTQYQRGRPAGNLKFHFQIFI